MESNAAFLISQAIAALIKVEAMRCANIAALAPDKQLPYSEADILKVIDEYGIGHNCALTTLGR